jgi:hypothetical protein
MHQHRLGKRERHTHKTGEALPQGVIPTLHMGSFSRLFSHGSMLLLWDDRSRDLQKVGEALALPILLWNGFPQPLARPFVPITHGIGDHLPCLTAKGNPNPGVKALFEHKRAIRSSNSRRVDVGSSGSGVSRVVHKGGSCALFFDPTGHRCTRNPRSVRVRPRKLLRS